MRLNLTLEDGVNAVSHLARLLLPLARSKLNSADYTRERIELMRQLLGSRAVPEHNSLIGYLVLTDSRTMPEKYAKRAREYFKEFSDVGEIEEIDFWDLMKKWPKAGDLAEKRGLPCLVVVATANGEPLTVVPLVEDRKNGKKEMWPLYATKKSWIDTEAPAGEERTEGVAEES